MYQRGKYLSSRELTRQCSKLNPLDHLKDSQIMGAWLSLWHSVYSIPPINIPKYHTAANIHCNHKQLWKKYTGKILTSLWPSAAYGGNWWSVCNTNSAPNQFYTQRKFPTIRDTCKARSFKNLTPIKQLIVHKGNGIYTGKSPVSTNPSSNRCFLLSKQNKFVTCFCPIRKLQN